MGHTCSVRAVSLIGGHTIRLVVRFSEAEVVDRSLGSVTMLVMHVSRFDWVRPPPTIVRSCRGRSIREGLPSRRIVSGSA